jgi:Uma2 family endonuclease
LKGPLRLDTYLAGPEQTRPSELVFGVVREPPAPKFGYQSVVVRTLYLIETHVRAHRLGQVGVAPTDVVLDRNLYRPLVVQPDVFFVSNERRQIIQDVVWGAPDLIVHVASCRTIIRDRTTKLAWYRSYGVRECWLVDRAQKRLVVADLSKKGRAAFRWFRGADRVRSAVLPAFEETAAAFFG